MDWKRSPTMRGEYPAKNREQTEQPGRDYQTSLKSPEGPTAKKMPTNTPRQKKQQESERSRYNERRPRSRAHSLKSLQALPINEATVF
ncbi:hypothetical protein NDU88_002194 [Pleurodeles waltl]|uniref:Uncharacterized protein n=1 Tax=Pleurodeles waltl TaxID=8319 RepID=A0AAV7QBZ6_PLEWA|nr:hypothetical protein NDU88_002194 [Pleurodeles waltl]